MMSEAVENIQSEESGNLPLSWVRARLREIAAINPTLDKSEIEDDLLVSFVPMPAVEAETGRIDVSTHRRFAEVKKGYTSFLEGDVLFAKITPCMENGKMAVVPALKNDLGFGSTEFHVLRPADRISPDYLYYFVSSKAFRIEAERNMTGAVGQRRVPTPFLNDSEIPLPSAAEQQRIVVKLDELFSELNKGVETLRTAQQQLKVYRQALLKHAFEGKLTADWRAQNPNKLESAEALLERIHQEREARHQQKLAEWKEALQAWEAAGKIGRKPAKPREPKALPPLTVEELAALPDLPVGWNWVRIGEAFGVYVGSTPSRSTPSYWGGKIPWVSSGEVAFCRIKSTKERITELGYLNASTEIHPSGTVVLAMIGEGKTRGQAAILDVAAAHNQNTAAIRVSESGCLPEFLYFYLCFQYEMTRKLGSGNNQKALNKERVSEMRIPFLSLAEQQALVQLVDEKFSVIDQLELTITTSLQQAESLRQSILKKAFAGQLVAQCPDDEPASVLLDRIRSERTAQQPARKRGRKAATSA